MKNTKNISKFFEELGCPLKIGYHWSAGSADKKRIVFTVWDDEIDDEKYILVPEESPYMKNSGGIQIKKDAELGLMSGVETLGVLCHKVDASVQPAKRDYFDEKSLLILELVREDAGVVAVITGEVTADAAIKGVASEHISKRRSALIDLDDVPDGALVPDLLRLEGFAYKRNRMVRDHVVRRSKGRCEYCGEEGFLMANGDRYIEAHHIISLGNDGPDTVSNVIGLCPKHHREAHFGEGAIGLNNAFKEIVESL